jgi:hypothetical protein
VSDELRAEVAGAIARLTQIITSDGPPRTPLRKVRMRDGTYLTQWISTPDAEVLTDGDPFAVMMRGRLMTTYYDPLDLYSMTPANAIALGHALIAAGHAATSGNVTPIGEGS